MIVLVVDDSQMIRRLLSAELLDLGVNQVLEAASAEQAEAVLKLCYNVDLILTDWHMPGMSGLDLLKKLKADSRLCNTPVVMTTSESHGDNVVAAMMAGAANYIIKPFGRKQLVEKIGPYITSAKANATASSGGLFAVSQAGKLAPNELGNLLQFLIQSKKTGRCELECDGYTACIYFDSGRIVGAIHQQHAREQAFFTCFSVPVKRYRFHEDGPPMPPELSISMNNTALLLEAATRRDSKSFQTA
jgi:two-component system chemotaxis response regulator CheY